MASSAARREGTIFRDTSPTSSTTIWDMTSGVASAQRMEVQLDGSRLLETGLDNFDGERSLTFQPPPGSYIDFSNSFFSAEFAVTDHVTAVDGTGAYRAPLATALIPGFQEAMFSTMRARIGSEVIASSTDGGMYDSAILQHVAGTPRSFEVGYGSLDSWEPSFRKRCENSAGEPTAQSILNPSDSLGPYGVATGLYNKGETRAYYRTYEWQPAALACLWNHGSAIPSAGATYRIEMTTYPDWRRRCIDSQFYFTPGADGSDMVAGFVDTTIGVANAPVQWLRPGIGLIRADPLNIGVNCDLLVKNFKLILSLVKPAKPYEWADRALSSRHLILNRPLYHTQKRAITGADSFEASFSIPGKASKLFLFCRKPTASSNTLDNRNLFGTDSLARAIDGGSPIQSLFILHGQNRYPQSDYQLAPHGGVSGPRAFADFMNALGLRSKADGGCISYQDWLGGASDGAASFPVRGNDQGAMTYFGFEIPSAGEGPQATSDIIVNIRFRDAVTTDLYLIAVSMSHVELIHDAASMSAVLTGVLDNPM